MSTGKTPSALFLLTGVAVLLLGALVYVPGLPGDFVFDDIGSIVNSPIMKPDHPGIAGFIQTLLSAPVGGLLRPISTLSFMLDARWFGLSPTPFKITNVGIHLGTAVVLWFVARDLLRAWAKRCPARAMHERHIAWLSLAATGLWMLHPINLTSVLYVVQRDNSLASLCASAAILCYLVGRRREIEGHGGTCLIWMGTPGLTALGMLCKENAALTPVFLLVVEFTLLRFQGKDNVPSRQASNFFLVYLVVPLLIFVGLLLVRPGIFLAAYDVRDFTMYERVLSESRYMVDYMRWIFAPDLHQLGLFHDDMAVSRGLLQPWTTLPSMLFLLALIAAAVFARSRFPLLSFGILWFFAGHLMESTILPLELVFEHRNYLPSFGLILGCVGTVYPVQGTAAERRLVTLALASGIVLLALTTALRAYEWRSELSFARTEVLHHPNSARAQSELQWAYTSYIVATHDASLVPEAVAAAERSKTNDTRSINQDIGLAYMFASLGQTARAQQALQSAAQRSATATPTATLQLALQSLLELANKNQQPLYADISNVFQRVLANPGVTKNDCYHGETWNTYAVFLESTEEIPGALDAYHRAVTLCPRDALIRVNFAEMLLRYGDTRDAKGEIDALDAMHNFRYAAQIQRLRSEYSRQVGLAPAK